VKPVACCDAVQPLQRGFGRSRKVGEYLREQLEEELVLKHNLALRQRLLEDSARGLRPEDGVTGLLLLQKLPKPRRNSLVLSAGQLAPS
jgi:hypothetical protein